MKGGGEEKIGALYLGKWWRRKFFDLFRRKTGDGADQMSPQLFQCGAAARALQLKCNLTFFRVGWQKIVAQIRGFFRKIFIYYPLWEQNLAPKHVFTPIFVFTPRRRVPGVGSGQRRPPEGRRRVIGDHGT